jgi:hypothetical protein
MLTFTEKQNLRFGYSANKKTKEDLDHTKFYNTDLNSVNTPEHPITEDGISDNMTQL